MLLTVLLFLIELGLALFVRDDFFRPFVGDLLVVILIYSFVRSFWYCRSYRLVMAVCLFAFLVEALQAFDPIGRFGFEEYTALSVVVGRTFSSLDLVAYTLGSVVNALVLRGEMVRDKQRAPSTERPSREL